ncbi:MAG: lactonase family protein [Reichenbachiella sp.]|uniref:lactonase family protein n=1 Tax=Reichenbachiella sp. TaxID=2184521 RepID=UPI002965FDC0|nr:lactonase family protein [Reichenbachiella sp.]MDW3212016.1 lactonase family protein [Reichenbachiella sp.]
MVKSLLFLLVSIFGWFHSESQPTHFVYVSHNLPVSEYGISVYNWEEESGKLTKVNQVSEVKTSSYLAVNQADSRLYTVNKEGIQSFKINRQTGELTLINAVDHMGKGPCYISISSDKKYVLVAYYVSGSFASYTIDENGGIGDGVSHIKHEGSSINQSRQEGPHAHMILPAPTGDLVYVTDLGTDEVKTYRLNDTGVFSKEPVSITKVTPGFGPRHLVFHPSLPYVYVLAELTGRVLTYVYHPELGITKKVGENGILPKGFDGFNKSADLHITPDGRFLYASNRGANTLAVGQIDQQIGGLNIISNESCGGDWPRAFEVDPSGKYLLVAQKRSDQISVMKIDSITGGYKKTSDIPVVKGPQCIKFLSR